MVLLTLFFIWKGIKEFYSQNPELLFDNFLTIALLLILLFQYSKWKFNKLSVIIALSALGLHHAKLYGTFFYSIPFDRIMHFVGTFALALIIYQMIKPSQKNVFTTALITILITMGLGTIIEHQEFIGYSIIGEGEGILGYGAGDWGEWNNISWDLIYNTLGAIVAALLSLLSYKNIEK